jgi:hypothetical protein
MKQKLLIGIALAVIVTIGLWLRHPAAPVAVPVAKLIPKPVAVASVPKLPKLVPFNTPKMVTVGSQPASSQSLASAGRNWSAIQTIADRNASYRTRLSACRSLSGPLTDADWAALKPFLLKPDGLDHGQLGQVIKNKLMDVLCSLNPPPAGLGEVLTAMYQDRGQDGVIRDYAVQHMTAYYEQLAVQDDSADARQDVENVLWQAVNETYSSIGGTALLALKRLAQEYPGLDQGKIAATALQMAQDNNVNELTHITAFQICAQLGTANALPIVAAAAKNGETIPVRLSAIGALGLLGGPEQLPYLNSVLAGTDDRLKLAAQHALQQITLRQASPAAKN